MKIGMVLDNEFTGDPRVANEVMTLQQAGHEVYVLCLNYGDKEPKENFHGATIVRIPINLWLKKKLTGLNNTVFNFYPYFWKKKIIRFIDEYKIQHLHVHDLWMLEGALRARAERPMRLNVDLHENFVFALHHYKYAQTFPGNLLISSEKWARCEKKWLKEVDEIIVVIEEAKERLIKLGIQPEKLNVVPNYVNINEFKRDDSVLTETLIQKFAQNKTLVYTGGFDIHRGLDIVISATVEVVKKIPEFKLILVGGGKVEDDLKSLVRKLSLEKYVDFPGYRPHKELPSYIKMADLCIIPHLKTEHTDNTIPHKLFQYMVYEKPVISSNCRPLERIINDACAGYVYKFDDPRACANVIIEAFQSDRNKIGSSGRIAVQNKYNWSEAGKVLTEIYKDKNVSKTVH